MGSVREAKVVGRSLARAGFREQPQLWGRASAEGQIRVRGGAEPVHWEVGRSRGGARAVGRRSWAGTGSPPENGALAWLADNVIVFVQRQQLGEAKVSDLDVRLALHQDVTRCQVAVHAAAGAQVLHALRTWDLDPRLT